MSSFTALNLSDDELDIEEHTRELQIEIALNTLNKALNFQKNKEFENAHLKYDELGRIEIIQLPNISNNPTINRLKYLYCRNRGILRLRELVDQYNLKNKKINDKSIDEKQQSDNIDLEILDTDISEDDNDIEISVYGEIIGSINDLLNATLCGEPDVKIIQILSSLFNHFGHPRLARLCYELKLSDSDDSKLNDDIRIDLDQPGELLVNQIELLGNYVDLLDRISDNNSRLYNKIKNCLQNNAFWNIIQKKNKNHKYNWNDILTLDEWNKENQHEQENLIIDISVNDNLVDFTSLFESIIDCVPKPKGRNKFYDGYLLTKSIVKNVEFNFNVNFTEVEEDDEKVNDHETMKEVENENDIVQFEDADDQLNESKDGDDNQEKSSCIILHNDDNDNDDNTDHKINQNSRINSVANHGRPEIDNSSNELDSKMIAHDTPADKKIENLEPQDSILIDTKLLDESKPKDAILRSTRSTRAKPEQHESYDQAKVTLKNHDIFISQTLPSFLNLCDVDIQFAPLMQLVLNGSDQNQDINLNVSIFYSCLSSWTDEYTQYLNVTDSKKTKSNKAITESESIRDILSITPTKTLSPQKFEKIDKSNFYPYLQVISKKNLHFTQIRIAIVEFIFECNLPTQHSLLCFEPLSKRALNMFKTVLDSVSLTLYKSFEHFILYDFDGINTNLEVLVSKFNIAVSVFEVLVDSYLKLNQEQKLKKSSHKQASMDHSNVENILVRRIEKWNQIIEEGFSIYTYKEISQLYEVWSRFTWFKIYYLQNSSQNIETYKLINTLSELSVVAKENNIYFPFVNFELIPVLNYENVQTQFSKLKILEIFDKNKESNEILENVLLDKKSNYSDNSKYQIQIQLENFIKSSNLPLKLRLWSLLLRYYRINNDILRYKIAFEKIIEIMMDEIKSEKILKLNDHQSKMAILTVIGFFGHFAKKFIQFCDDTNFSCFNDNNSIVGKKMVYCVSSYLYMLYTFLMYQKAVVVDHRTSLSAKSSKSFEILNDCVTSCFTLLVFYYPNTFNISNPGYINDFLSVCHIELGLRHMCSSLNGSFLKYLQYKLTSLDFKISANDVFQIIHCRFGLSISLETFETFDHKCKPKRMNVDDAIQLSKFVSTYCYQRKHPSLSPPRNDIKNIIDKIVDVVGNPDASDKAIVGNKIILDSYLTKTNIDFKFIIDIFQGKFNLPFERPKFLGQIVADNGLYYIEGLIGLHFFKVRKRTMQSRAAELDYVLKMLENDVICGCNRFETWISLGQTYSFLVEDDLIWTADKLNSIERKHVTSLSQKKALLCYLMAICLHFKSSEEEKIRQKEIISSLWESFGKELYNAWMDPMNKKAFHMFVDSEENTMNSSKVLQLNSLPNDLPNDVVYKMLELSFKSAAESDDTSWYDYMYLAKSRSKLNYQNIEPRIIIDNFLTSCDLALRQSSKDDPIIEPHYYLFSGITKFYDSSLISLNEAIEFFKRDVLFSTIFVSETPIDSFQQLKFKILEKLISYDKKNWQHRPVYKLARAYYDNNDITNAKEEMLKVINLKPNIRSLSTIWKPSNERPGKHFLYNSEYTLFLVQLLYETGDIYSLSILLKKMRRAGSIMVNITKTFDNMMLRICILIKKILKLEPGFLDDSISKIKFLDFVKYSSEFIEYIKTLRPDSFADDFQLHLYFLSETQSFRKLATGFGATGLIDECYHSIYIKLFMPFLFKRLLEDRNDRSSLSELLLKAKEFSVEKANGSKQCTPDLPDKLERPDKSEELLQNEREVFTGDIEKDNNQPNMGTNTDTINVLVGKAGVSTITKKSSKDMNDLEKKDLSLDTCNNADDDGNKDGTDNKTVYELGDNKEHNQDHENDLASNDDNNVLAIPNKESSVLIGDLSVQDQYCIINYLSFQNISVLGTPSKEKVKVARRDVSPFAAKLVLATQSIIDDLKEKTNDGETIEYQIPGPLDNTEFEKAIFGVMVKETKENKEDKEFEKLISAHDRSLTGGELNDFNKILGLFHISKLKEAVTSVKSNVEGDIDGNFEKDVEMDVEMDVKMDTKEGRVESYMIEKVDKESTNLPDEPKKDECFSPKFEKTNLEMPSKSPPFLQKNDDQTINTTPVSSIKRKRDDLDLILVSSKHQKVEDKDVVDIEVKPLIWGKTKNSTDMKEKNLINLGDSVSSTDTALKNDENDVILKIPRIDEKIFGSKKNIGKTPTRKTQPVITNFFKKSPNKSDSPIKPNEDYKNDDDILSVEVDGVKKVKLGKEKENVFMEDSDNLESENDVFYDTKLFEPPSQHKKKEIVTNTYSSPRRNSRRSTNSTLMELSKSGNPKEQVDYKLERKRELMKNAEVLISSSSSEENDDDIIVID